MFTTLLETNTECSCEQYSNLQTTAMGPKKAKASTLEQASTLEKEASDAVGEQSGRSSPSAAEGSSRFASPSSSPQKGRLRRGAASTTPRETSLPIPEGTAYAQLSRGRAPSNQIRQISAAPDAVLALQSSGLAARKTLSGASRTQKVRASLHTHAEDVPVDDQHTQDLAGQEAAPDMRFEVSFRTCRGHAHIFLCVAMHPSVCAHAPAPEMADRFGGVCVHIGSTGNTMIKGCRSGPALMGCFIRSCRRRLTC